MSPIWYLLRRYPFASLYALVSFLLMTQFRQFLVCTFQFSIDSELLDSLECVLQWVFDDN